MGVLKVLKNLILVPVLTAKQPNLLTTAVEHIFHLFEQRRRTSVAHNPPFPELDLDQFYLLSPPNLPPVRVAKHPPIETGLETMVCAGGILLHFPIHNGRTMGVSKEKEVGPDLDPNVPVHTWDWVLCPVTGAAFKVVDQLLLVSQIPETSTYGLADLLERFWENVSPLLVIHKGAVFTVARALG